MTSPNGVPTFSVPSPIEDFPGSVVFPIYLTMPQVMNWEQSIRDFKKEAVARGYRMEGDNTDISVEGGADIDQIMIEAICGIVSRFELEGLPPTLTPETFPGTPRASSAALIGWIMGEISQVYRGVRNVPKE